ncbi:LCP family protein [Nocardia goodfellowii]|uniref:LCP family protein required for cell wall assembly n=1 Tax=Nocardia goodfellowii TaxID=882446 RepID=A0ABS4Q8X8_9NOCA|nr:LCP family protein [Nocardia goodfellowii]MBP2188148.1 LCP family protein required for cell wall assembly [Nocardia goodfellowii]
MNGDDHQRSNRPRRMPPPDYVPGSAGAQHAKPTEVLRRDGRAYEPPQAYSQMRRQQAPPPPPRRTHAPTQQPQPYHEPAPRQRRQPPPPPPAAPPTRREREPRPPRARRKRHPFRWFLIFLLVFVVGSVAGVIHLDGKLQRIDALADYEGRVGDTPGTNWLLVGSDSRTGLTPEQENELATGGDVGSERTDTIMLIHVPKSGGTTMVSLPRDSYVSIPGYGRDKLNAAFTFGGAQLLVQTVEIATGLHIDHYAQIGFAGFAGIVDALGGIDLCVPTPIDDPLAGINLDAGCQKLGGAEALGFVRSRATALADIDRMNNQRLFMSALLKKATSWSTLINPFKLWPLASDTAKSLKVDEGDHLWHLGRLGWALRADTVTTTVPIGGFDNTASGNVLVWDKTKASEFFEALASDQPVPEALLTR